MKILLWVVGGLVVVGAGLFAMRGSGTSTSVSAPSGTATSTSWVDIIKQGGDHTCVVSVTKGPVASTGTIFVSGKDVRGDFVSQINGQVMHSYMIMTGGYVYNWADKLPQGVKIPALPNADPVTIMSKTQSDMQGVTYDCKPWWRNPAKFAIPTDVKFVTIPGAPSTPTR